MEYLLAVDGGSSKTKFVLYSLTGKPASAVTLGGSAQADIGGEEALAVLQSGAQKALQAAGAGADSLLYSAFCLASIGEDEAKDAALRRGLEAALGRVLLANDAEAALWAGLSGKAGIVVVSGTGSVGFGRDEAGNTARSGGYAPSVSDEGSAYWLGRLALEMYTKQSDGRLPRGALFGLVNGHLDIRDAYGLMGWLAQNPITVRHKIANLQLLVQAACEQGDESAMEAYRLAAAELALLAKGVKAQLGFDAGTVPVTYAGGVFIAGTWLLNPLSERLWEMGCKLSLPRFLDPIYGAAMLAAKGAGIPPADFAARLMNPSLTS